jgi:DNA-binding NtrC family response regulator
VDSATGPTILIIDDYDSVRIAISMILRKHGFNVLAAENAAAAKRIWAQSRSSIELLLVDISMPTITGPELVRELLKEGPRIPVIFVTGIGEVQAREATRDLPTPLILQKPFSPQLLIELVETQCGRVPATTRP